MKKLLLFLLGIGISTQFCFGAIAYTNSAVTDANDNSGCCGDFSMSYTTSGTDRLLIVAISGDNSQQSTAVTYGGVSMTLLNTLTSANGSHSTTDVWYLINPASGANTLAVSRNGYGRGVIASYSGVKQTGFPDASTVTSGTNNPQVVATTVVASDAWLIGVSQAVMSISGNTARLSRTQRQTSTAIRPATPYLGTAIGDSNGTVTTGSQSFNFDSTAGGSYYAYGGFTISVAPTPPAVVSTANRYFGFFKIFRFR